MRAINHALTGSLIGLTVSEPAAALPLALLSHFVLDAIPHFDPLSNKLPLARRQAWMRTKLYRQTLFLDAILCFVLVAFFALRRPQNWLLACICAFVAAAPDLLSFDYYRHILRRQQWKPNLYFRFAKKIQWFERPAGAAVELSWLAACLILLSPFFR